MFMYFKHEFYENHLVFHNITQSNESVLSIQRFTRVICRLQVRGESYRIDNTSVNYAAIVRHGVKL